MTFTPGPLEGLVIIQPKVLGDDRGYFYESYHKLNFHQHGLDLDFVQDNQSMSLKGALRGLHFQAPPYEQGKLVRVIKGSVMDVMLDIRNSSKTYGQHFKLLLSGENHTMIWIPPGFAHGFVTLEDQTIFTYKCTGLYHKPSEGGVLWNDPELGIDWGVNEPIVSAKDLENEPFALLKSPF